MVDLFGISNYTDTRVYFNISSTQVPELDKYTNTAGSVTILFSLYSLVDSTCTKDIFNFVIGKFLSTNFSAICKNFA